MPRVFADVTITLDGHLAGPDASLKDPLGIEGMRVHQWVYGLEARRKPQGLEGGRAGGVDSDVLDENAGRADAAIMGRKMFYPTAGNWQEPPQGQWGDEPPFHTPVYVLTHYAHEPVEKEGGTTFHFVTDGIESALEQARTVAGETDIQISGGAEVIQEFIRAGLLDELKVHIVPIFLGQGVLLLSNLGESPRTLVPDRALHSDAVTHVRYRFT